MKHKLSIKKYVQFLCWNPKKHHINVDIYIYINPLQKKTPIGPTHPTKRCPLFVSEDNPRVKLLDGVNFPKPPRYLDGVSFSDRLFWLFLTESVVFKGTSSLWLGVKWRNGGFFGFGWTRGGSKQTNSITRKQQANNKQTTNKQANNKANKDNNKQQNDK